jgi:hypothetical protein
MVVELTHEEEAGTEGLPEEASGTLEEGVATGYSGYSGTLEVSPAGLLGEATG